LAIGPFQLDGLEVLVSEPVRWLHIASSRAVGQEEARLLKALVDGGYDASGLDLVPLARAAVVRDLIAQVKAAGAHIISAPWSERSDGGVEIEFELVGEAGRAVAMMALSD
jgi:hypothetical protein